MQTLCGQGASDSKADVPAVMLDYDACLDTRDLPKVILVLGKPGAGKNTVADGLLLELPDIYTRLSTGNFCRKQVREQTNWGKQISEYMSAGCAVPDNIMYDILKEFLNAAHRKGQITILDGFPLTIPQVNFLRNNAKILTVLYICAEDETCVQRILRRRTVQETDFVWDETKHPDPAIEALLGVYRADDRSEKRIRARIEYALSLFPEVCYCLRNELQWIDATQSCTRRDVLESAKLCLQDVKPRPNAFCSKCNTRVALAMSFPCGHRALCYNCTRPSPAQCPACASAIRGFMHLEPWANDLVRRHQLEEEGKQTISLRGIISSDLTHSLSGAVAVNIADTTKTLPYAVVVVLDVSNSMSTQVQVEVTKPDGSTEMRGDPRSRLDFMKLAIRAVLRCLGPQAQFGLVTFANTANVVCKLTSNVADPSILAKVDMIKPDGFTNVAKGLKEGLDMLNSVKGHRTLVLLSDGEPTDHDKAVELLRGTRDQDLHVGVFGLSAALKPGYMTQLAQHGNGTFTFLPDAGTIPGVMSSFMANVRSKALQSAILHLEAVNGATLIKVPQSDCHENQIMTDCPTKHMYNLGPVCFGQEKYVHFKLAKTDAMSVLQGKYAKPYIKASLKDARGKLLACSEIDTAYIVEAEKAWIDAKIALVSDVQVAIADENRAEERIKTLIFQLAKTRHLHPYIQAIWQTLQAENARVPKGLCQKRATWGRFWAEAWLSSHMASMCNDDMNADLSIYRSRVIFSAVKDEARAAFGETFVLDIPTPCKEVAPETKTASMNLLTTKTVMQLQEQVIQASFGGGSSSTGCFAPWTKVQTEDGVRNISEIRAGQSVWTGKTWAKVDHVVEMRGNFRVYGFKTPFITATHPILTDDGKVTSMKKLGISNSTSVASVFNLILDADHTLMAEHYVCVTWGHGFDIPGLAHTFYGNRTAVLMALMMRGTIQNGVHIVQGTLR
jgi:adenylate kinase family enzyme/Mg-chelatase subunit ChlD